MDRTLSHWLFLFSITACAAGPGGEPCAQPPPQTNPHAGDLTDTTEKEAVSSKPSETGPVTPAPSEPAPAASTEGAQCEVPAKTCGDVETCRSLEALCHTIGDPIARNDTDAFVKISVSDENNADAISKKGGPRAHLGFASQGPLKVTLGRDCTMCRRSFVSYDLRVGDVTVRAMVEGGRITSWSKAK
jgi:hypothetical protein